MPNGTAIVAMSVTTPRVPPRATQRRSPMTTARTTPVMIASAYARSGTGPRCHTPCDGLGR
jgi:hypothetical protein